MIWAIITVIMGTLMPVPVSKCNPGEMIPQLKRHEIQVLLKAGFTAKDTAARSGVSLDTVRRVHAEDPVAHTDDAAARAGRRIGRPSKAVSFTQRVTKWIDEDPDLPTQELLVSGLRPPKGTPVVRFEGLPGEFSQHDFGHVDVKFVDGRTKRIHFFASRLKYSRFARVTLVENERAETIVRCLARDFSAFGGLPLMN